MFEECLNLMGSKVDLKGLECLEVMGSVWGL